MRSASTRARPVSDKPLDLDKHRGMAAQKATDIRRILADVENNAKALRDRQGIFENQLLSVPAATWPEAAAKARYVLNLYVAALAPAASEPCPTMSGNDSLAAKRALVPQRSPQPPRFIAIEGPLRVGKTTLARILAERLHARRIYDCEDNPFLADFYKAKPGAAFRAQMYFLIERQKHLREGLAVEALGLILSDFLLEKDRIFANLNLDDQELKLYERYYELLSADLPAPDLVIYLQAKPEVLRARIAKKASREESQISLEYIEEVTRAYEHFFFRYSASDLLVINTSEIDFVERSDDLQQLLRRLQDPVKGTQYFLPLGASE